MATVTVVLTYTAASGEVADRVTSFTYGGTAFASLTKTQVRQAIDLLEKAAKLTSSPAVATTTARQDEVAGGR